MEDTAVKHDLLSIDRRALIGFYDDPAPEEHGIHAAAINALAREDLGLALLMDCLRQTGADTQLLDTPCTTGGRKGPRLDGWIQSSDVLYQVEVKNWSANSLGGRRLALDANADFARAHRRSVWNEYWNGSTFVEEAAAKVLEPMKPPIGGMTVAPLIAFWVALHPAGDADPLFRIPLSGHPFEYLVVFSMSTYLRNLKSESIDLPLPKTRARLAILQRLFLASSCTGVQQALHRFAPEGSETRKP